MSNNQSTSINKSRFFRAVVACSLSLGLLMGSAAQAKDIELSGKAADFSLPSNLNKTLKLSDFRGEVVMVNFWASWCGPCRQEMPLLDDLQKRFKKIGFTVLGVNIDEDVADAKNLLKEIPVSFPVVFDSKNKVSEIYQLDSMPTTVMVDRKGNKRFLHRGYKPGFEVDYERQIRALLRE
ncbi:redoxin [Gammaproteobacteria bacterium 45_16_T64]|nr:redoxin [Gammaproteobacteria bacterium 45_16_T64]